MSDIIQRGGCQCGKIRYKLKARPHTVYCCHCTECQKQSSSAFGISVRVDANAVDIDGAPKTIRRSSPGGGLDCDFCPDCGTRLFHRRPGYGETMNIKGGTFDDTSWLEPAGHLWLKSKQNWVVIPEGAMAYDGQPADYEALVERYRISPPPHPRKAP